MNDVHTFLDAVGSGLWAGFGLAVPVGALAVLLLDLTARSGFRTGAAAAVGVGLADAGYATAAVCGGAALAESLSPYSSTMRWLGAVVLIGMAARIVARGVRGTDGAAERAAVGPMRAFGLFLGLTALNPWPAVYFLALVLGGSAAAVADGTARIGYLAAVFLASLSWQLTLAVAGAALGRVRLGRRTRSVTAVLSGLLVLGLAVSMVAGG